MYISINVGCLEVEAAYIFCIRKTGLNHIFNEYWSTYKNIHLLFKRLGLD